MEEERQEKSGEYDENIENIDIESNYASDYEGENDEEYNIKKINQKEIDEITLKLLSNYGKFNKCLSINEDNENIIKNRELNVKKVFFKNRIIDYTSELIDNINFAANNEIRENFNAYVYSVIKHLEYDTSLLEGEDYVRDRYDYKKLS